MKLNHIGLNIQSKTELLDFYQDILGLKFEYQFELTSDFASKIFGIDNQPEVFHYKNEHINLELFVNPDNSIHGYAHICIEVTDLKSIAAKCEQSGYPVIRIKRIDRHDILFIKDKTGNIFELKEGK